jgi:hypothetical protein
MRKEPPAKRRMVAGWGAWSDATAAPRLQLLGRDNTQVAALDQPPPRHLPAERGHAAAAHTAAQARAPHLTRRCSSPSNVAATEPWQQSCLTPTTAGPQPRPPHR